MTRLAWERYEGNDVEAVVAMLVNRERPNSVRITPSRGDGGIDILERGASENGGDVVYQVKRYTQPLSASQRDNVEESWTRLNSDPRWAELDVQEWHLVTPWDPTPEAEAWLQSLDPSGRAVVWNGLSYIEGLAAKYPEVIDYYLEGGRGRIEAAYESVVALLAPTEATAAPDAPSVSARLSKALNVLDSDPHYRYEFRFGQGEPVSTVDRPNLVMTWIQSDGTGKKWQAVDVIARCAVSISERPIVVTGTVKAESGSDLAASLQDFVDYGAPFASPTGSFTGSIDAPGGLGGPLVDAAVRVSVSGDDLGADPNLVLSVRTAGGEAIAETELVRTERSEGRKGLRVVLKQKNNVFTIEDRYTTTGGGKRQFRFGDYSNEPATDVRQALAVLAAASTENTVLVRRKGAPPSSAHPDPNWNFGFGEKVRILLDGVTYPVDALARLQQHTGQIVRVPDLTQTTAAQVAEWQRVASVLEGKEVAATYPDGHALGVELSIRLETVPNPLLVEMPLEVIVGEQKVTFGTAVLSIDDATIVDQQETDGGFLHHFKIPDRKVRFSLHK
jgi:hypothetical protein